jgi:nicotinate-nucleotide--dimethylbenzimidazole phosphoribosyltransferase
MLEEILRARRNTLHFTREEVPHQVLEKALQAGHQASSVGLTDATRYFIIRSPEVKQGINKFFKKHNSKTLSPFKDRGQKSANAALQLKAILEAPLGIVVCYDRSVLNAFSAGMEASNDTLKFSAVCAVQNLWLSLTEQGYALGWVHIPDHDQFKKLLAMPGETEPLGYFCIGKPATDFDKQPLFQHLNRKQKSAGPMVSEISTFLKPILPPVEKALMNSGGSQSLSQQLRYIIDHKTKPRGALGELENLAWQIGTVFNTTTPLIKKPHLVVFAADHGIAQHGVSAYPQEVTSQMVQNFTEGGAAINVFCKQHGIALTIVDAGVNDDFAPDLPILHHKMGRGTHSFLQGPAMTLDQVYTCLQKGAEVVNDIFGKGCNTVGFGEMGIGNTSTAAVLMSMLASVPIEQCIGKGTGVSDEKLLRKHQILRQAIINYPGDPDIYRIMAWFGGFEILQMAGAMIAAHKNDMLLLVDGFIATTAFLCAYKINPAIKQNAVFCHQSDEAGHQRLLELLAAKPLLQLGLRLGEGTGCALAFPLLQSAVAFLTGMASFQSVGISNKV